MILQALVRYYEDLLQNGTLRAPGWVKEKISWGLQLADDGQPLVLHDLRTSQQRGKKTVLLPREEFVPERVKRSSGVAANFLCDNSSYIFGADAKGKPERAAQCFAACRALHQDILQDTFFTAFQKISDLKFPENFSAWIIRIAVNKCKMSFRSAVPQTDDEEVLEEFKDDGMIPDDYVDSEEKRKIIMDIIDTVLTPEQRQTIILYYYDSMSVAEISKINI